MFENNIILHRLSYHGISLGGYQVCLRLIVRILLDFGCIDTIKAEKFFVKSIINNLFIPWLTSNSDFKYTSEIFGKYVSLTLRKVSF